MTMILKPRSLGLTTFIASRFLSLPITAMDIIITAANRQAESNLQRAMLIRHGKRWRKEWETRKAKA